MFQFLSIIFFLGFLQFLLGFSKVPVFLCDPVFRTVPLSIIRSFSLYTKQWYMSYKFADGLRAGSG